MYGDLFRRKGLTFRTGHSRRSTEMVEGEVAQWSEREFTDRKVRDSNPTSASRLLLSRLGQPGSTQAVVLPSVAS
ncbi:hypothetical protein T265_07322 [Opisthorchis viverrini]|uniref:Uncharacterized protein n=1 Tax=Opisthorchis viverrini TaxID=6198 RepID=A0A074ZHH9_OPIVI|nr:hypothetical protein T265_07322 [Opisthorchis viverrini]KER25157.1 hypothetical protein T265_07322 [Opisthorchis viverrini]